MAVRVMRRRRAVFLTSFRRQKGEEGEEARKLDYLNGKKKKGKREHLYTRTVKLESLPVPKIPGDQKGDLISTYKQVYIGDLITLNFLDLLPNLPVNERPWRRKKRPWRREKRPVYECFTDFISKTLLKRAQEKHKAT